MKSEALGANSPKTPCEKGNQMNFQAFLAVTFLGSAIFAQTASVTVDQGYLSRNLTPGATAHVWAQQNTATRLFSGWAGDTQYLMDSAAPYTTFTVPNSKVALRATYRSVPSWTYKTENFSNIPVTYYVPANPVALVFLFHGTGGTGLGQFTGSEFGSLTRDLVGAGFAVAAFDCLNQQTGQWDTATTGPTNPDVQRVNSILAAMRAKGIVPQELPLLAFGHSNGGQFSHFSSLTIPWRAVYISCVQGSQGASTTYTGPVAWWMGKNDDHPQVGPAGVQSAIARFDLIANRGVLARHWITDKMPLFPERLARSAFLTMADSIEVYNIFKSKGWLDANDFILRNPNTDFPNVDYWRSSMPARLTAGQLVAVQGQLEGTNAGHEFQNFTPHVIIDHFLGAIGRRPALHPINGASFTGDSTAPASIATIFFGGLADALEVAATGPQKDLRNVHAVIRTAAGQEVSVPWFFVSPGQGSFLVPDTIPAGNVTLKIQSGDRRWAIPVTVARTAPGIFTANGNGQGAPAAVILRVAPDNTRSTEFPFAAGPAGFVAAPIRFGEDRLFLDLYATGVRGASDVRVRIGGETLTPLYSGAQPQYAGLDQVTFELPKGFAGRGESDVTILSGSISSNSVKLLF